MHVHEATIPGEDFEHAAPFAPSVRNAHSRVIQASIDRVRPWIAACWTGTDGDPFPRDFIRSWRKNPPGEDPLALVPNVTRVGHGAFSFRFVSWDGALSSRECQIRLRGGSGRSPAQCPSGRASPLVRSRA